MTLDLQTPTLLFPAISLLLLAYTNRYLHLASLIRNLHGLHKKRPIHRSSRKSAISDSGSA